MEQVIATDQLKPVIGARVRNLRKKSGLSQSQLAKELDVSELTILRLENGQTEPGATLLYSLADFFEVSADALRQVSQIEEKSSVSA